ncbi:Os03g0178900 [Oryza sativa Japonica Group]|uniref:Os03g0178900 protein n=4 Tax=Oryza TaxID=4527 RepID=A0A0P0VTT9_ORYSJ|nr:Os03g0178900 [Oryza sativa Japonica Group]
MPMAFSGMFSGRVDKEYFVYKAGSGTESPSLRRIPTHDPRYNRGEDIGIIRCGDHGQFFLAALLFTSCNIREFTLHLYSSASDQWTMKSVPLDPSCNLERVDSKYYPALPHKTIQLGGSLLGWVDLWKGILICDVLADHPVVRFIRLPELMPGNYCHDSPHMIRDVHCMGGVIKFIEMEHFLIPTVEPTQEPTQGRRRPGEEANILYDWDLEPPCKEDAPDPDIWLKSFVGWRTVIWDRMVYGNCWNKVCKASYDEIMVPDPSHYEMLSELGDGSAGNLVLMNLSTDSPTLSIGGDNVVHMSSIVKLDRGRSVMMALNLQRKTVEALALYGPERKTCHPYRPCTLSKYLKISPGSFRDWKVNDLPRAISKPVPQPISMRPWRTDLGGSRHQRRAAPY